MTRRLACRGFGDQLLATAAAASPAIDRTLRRWGDRPLADFLASLTVAGSAEPLQPRDDLWAEVHASVAEHHGHDVAGSVVADLRADPTVPTSNHFGIDTVADSVQGTLLFTLRPGAERRSRTAVVFGFGSVSMNNFSYPLGLRLYDSVDELPRRLPIFPNRLKQVVVAKAPPFDEDMVHRARARLDRLAVSPSCREAAGRVLDEVFAGPALAKGSYGGQSAVVNAELWSRMLGGGPSPRFVQVPVEATCARLLACDLDDSGSLVHRLLFDERVRERLLDRLDGAPACWRRAAPATGTLFFWGLSARGRRFPLRLEDRAGGGPGRGAACLAGVDERGARHAVPFSPDGIVAGLVAGTLLPSLFTCFAALAFARGLGCVGGYYQAGYLPVMRAGVVHALGPGTDADAVAQVPADLCLAGLQGLVRELDDGSVVPAGPVELAGGGAEPAALRRLPLLTVRDAARLALTEVLGELVPNDRLPERWARRLATENGRLWRRYRDRPSAGCAT